MCDLWSSLVFRVTWLSFILCLSPRLMAASNQLSRTTNSGCGSVACQGDSVQYQCLLPGTGSVIWTLSDCRDLTLLQGETELNTSCGSMELSVQVKMENNSLVSFLNVGNISREYSVKCKFDDGRQEKTVGTEIVTLTAPAPEIIQNGTTHDLIFTWDVKYEQCPALQYDVSNSTNCGTCSNTNANKVVCTGGLVGVQCTFKLDVVVCGAVVNQSELTVTFPSTSTLSSTTVRSPAMTNYNRDPFLSDGAIAGIVVSVIVLILVILVAVVLLSLFVYKRISHGTTKGISDKEQNAPPSNSSKLQMLGHQKVSSKPTPSSPSSSACEDASVATSTTKLLSEQKSSHHTKDITPSRLDFGSASMEQGSPPNPTNLQTPIAELSVEVLTTEKSEVPRSESSDYSSSATAQGPSEAKQNAEIANGSHESSTFTAASERPLSTSELGSNSMRHETSVAGIANSNFGVGQSTDVRDVEREDSFQLDGDKFPTSVDEDDKIANGISRPNSEGHSYPSGGGDMNSADTPWSHTENEIAQPEIPASTAAVLYTNSSGPAIRTGTCTTSFQRSHEVGLFRADLGDTPDYHPAQKESTPLEKLSKHHVDEDTSGIHERLSEIIDGQKQLQKEFVDVKQTLTAKITELENLIKEKDDKIMKLETSMAKLEKENEEDRVALRNLEQMLEKEKTERKNMKQDYEVKLSLLRKENEKLKASI